VGASPINTCACGGGVCGAVSCLAPLAVQLWVGLACSKSSQPASGDRPGHALMGGGQWLFAPCWGASHSMP
jgi:hypothetical protein